MTDKFAFIEAACCLSWRPLSMSVKNEDNKKLLYSRRLPYLHWRWWQPGRKNCWPRAASSSDRSSGSAQGILWPPTLLPHGTLSRGSHNDFCVFVISHFRFPPDQRRPVILGKSVKTSQIILQTYNVWIRSYNFGLAVYGYLIELSNFFLNLKFF